MDTVILSGADCAGRNGFDVEMPNADHGDEPWTNVHVETSETVGMVLEME